MKITLEYRNPTPAHCDVVFWINGANAGKLTLRQEELLTFQGILANGTDNPFDTFLSQGNPDWKKEK